MIRFRYAINLLDNTTANRLISHFGQIVQRLRSDSQCPLSEISMVTAKDEAQIFEWNALSLVTVDSRVSDFFNTRAEEHPDSVAIYAWDGEVSYCQLQALSFRPKARSRLKRRRARSDGATTFRQIHLRRDSNDGGTGSWRLFRSTRSLSPI